MGALLSATSSGGMRTRSPAASLVSGFIRPLLTLTSPLRIALYIRVLGTPLSVRKRKLSTRCPDSSSEIDMNCTLVFVTSALHSSLSRRPNRSFASGSIDVMRPQCYAPAPVSLSAIFYAKAKRRTVCSRQSLPERVSRSKRRRDGI